MQPLRLPMLPCATVCLVAACAPRSAEPPAPPPEPETQTVVVTDTVIVERTAEMEARLARLEIQLLEKDQQIQDLSDELVAARQEVVRNLAKIQSQATRAEAASALAEAEIAVDGLEREAGGEALPEFAEATARLTEGSAEFTAENFGGAVYLANEARAIARSGQQRLRAVGGGSLSTGEALFAIPVALRTTSRSNVRAGPGLDHAVRYTLDPETEVVGQSYTSQWVRIVDGEGREGWIFSSLVTGRGR